MINVRTREKMSGKYQLEVKIETPLSKGEIKNIEEKLVPALGKFKEDRLPLISILDMNHGGRLVEQRRLNDYIGTETFELPDGYYRVITASIYHTTFENVRLDKNIKVTLGTPLQMARYGTDFRDLFFHYIF